MANMLKPGVVIAKSGRIIQGIELESTSVECFQDGDDVLFNMNIQVRLPKSQVHMTDFDSDTTYPHDDGAEKIYIQFDSPQKIANINLTGTRVYDPNAGMQNVDIAFSLNYTNSKTRWGKTRWDGTNIH